MNHPWTKFYWSDWRSDPRLRMCSIAARGLWIEMLALMHEAQPYGHLLVSGHAPTDAQLAVLAGMPSDDLPELLGELATAGVFSRTAQGVIYSRRMTRDHKKARIAVKNGKTGGNPSLCKQKGKSASDNHQDKGRDKPQKPEARYQRELTGDSAREDFAPLDRVLDVIPGGHNNPNLVAAYGHFQTWLRMGAELEADILPTVKRVIAHRKQQSPINSLGFFDREIADAVQNRKRTVEEFANGTSPANPRSARPGYLDPAAANTAAFARVAERHANRRHREEREGGRDIEAGSA